MPVPGYIQSPLWDGHTPYAAGLDSWTTLHVPRGSVVLFNFTQISWIDCGASTRLYVYQGGREARHLVKTHWCHYNLPAPAIYNQTLHLHFRTGIINHFGDKGFRLSFGLHSVPRVLQKVDDSTHLVQDEFGETEFYERNNVWNCSVPFWEDYASYFPCNARWNCVRGEDEVDCPYNNYSMCDVGQVWVGRSCYKLDHRHYKRWKDAALRCIERGGALASLNTPDEWEMVQRYLPLRVYSSSWIGLKSFDAHASLMYS